ncbi:MAG: hypothetical protein GY820_21905, partial [Gammaproteobacteria bacterium]|nr:hypothetical protein [Gammaproteobacteria bacterium]
DAIFQGHISVKAGALSGDGGFIETSGKENLTYLGSTDRSAVNGKDGSLLLDPNDITIVDSGGGTTDDNELSDQEIAFGDSASSGFTISNTRIEDELDNGDVLLQANRNIRVNAAIDSSANTNNTNNLTLEAGDDLAVDARINLGEGDLTLIAGSAGCDLTCNASGSKDLNINKKLNTTGAITLIAADHVIIDDDIGNTAQASSLRVHAGDSITLNSNGSINTSGQVSLTASDASLTDDPDGAGPLLPIAVAANGTVTGDIQLKGSTTTNGGNFTATTTAGYFD